MIQNGGMGAETHISIDRIAERLRQIHALTGQLEESREELRLVRLELAEALAEIEGLRTAMETRAVIEQAKGMIMVTLKLDPDAAFEVLVDRSQRTHTKLHEVAAEMVADMSKAAGA